MDLKNIDVCPEAGDASVDSVEDVLPRESFLHAVVTNMSARFRPSGQTPRT